MYGAGIRDAVVNRWSQQVSVSAACVGMLSLLDFLELGSSNYQIETTAKRARNRDALVVEHYKKGRRVSMSFWFPYLLVYSAASSMISDLLCYAD